ncbi:MAG: Ycf66 family protein [Scytonema sp. PMC 1069.18]|nr:Ycf66 family protein [Scytonema sp. PMC 1069.18]MEC4883444.1 Ycf66 family protein [Scytonema sp. PMC 1070.18]
MLMFGLNSASVLAQVNFGANSASILGIFLAVAGAALYFLRSVRPELSRDQDIFFAAVGLLCGFILIFQGWRLDPILQFGQLLLVGSTVFFAVESIRLRGIATQQAKRNTPIVDDEREVSDRYQYSRRSNYKAQVDAELEPLPYDDDEPPPRRIPGSRDSRSSRDDYYYEDEAPRRPERRSSAKRTTDKNRRPSSGRSTRTSERFDEKFEDENWGASSKPPVDDWDSSVTSEERRSPRRSSSGSSVRPETPDADVPPPRPRRRRPPSDSAPRVDRQEDDVISTEYVEYKPINRSERPDEDDNSGIFDDDV